MDTTEQPDGQPEQQQNELQKVESANSKPVLLFVAIGVLVLALLGMSVGLFVVNGQKSDAQQALSQSQTELETTKSALNTAEMAAGQAQAEAQRWEDVGEGWRECAVASLQIARGLLNDGLIGGLSPTGEASAICEDAREEYDKVAAGGQDYA